MPNMPDINKRTRGVQLPLELWARLRKEASKRAMSVNQLINFILHEQLDGIALDEEDYEWIKMEVSKNEHKRN